MARRLSLPLALALAAALFAGGCGDDDDSAADTTTSATPTATASAPETTPTAPATTPEAPPRPGSVAAGKQAFQASPCAGCHAGLGTRAAFGPKLSGQGLTKATIRTTVVNGRGQMPADLVSGQELEDIVAYVFSLQ